MPFCFLIRNFAEIGHSADELWPKKRIFNMTSSAILNVKKLIFAGMTVIEFTKFLESGRFFTEIWRFNYFQNSGRPPSWF